MDGYVQVSLNDMLNQIREDDVKSILSNFSCPLNKDVEKFLKKTAIVFARQSIAQTHLVFASYKGKLELVGYFTLAYKFFSFNKGAVSRSFKKRISKFGTYDKTREEYIIPAPLIAQLGKNYECGLDKLISGDELLLMAIEKVAAVQQNVGGKLVYLECEDKPKLIDFYSGNGFMSFGRRELDRDEVEVMDGRYLIQMLKIIK